MSKSPRPETQGLHGGLAALPLGGPKHREALSGCSRVPEDLGSAAPAHLGTDNLTETQRTGAE